MSIRCRLGVHDFRWPPHHIWPMSLWEEVRIECARGCGARVVRRCHSDQHWAENHPDDRLREPSR